MHEMHKKSKRRRLFIRRTIVCLCLALILYLAVEGTIIVVRGITGRPSEPGKNPNQAAMTHVWENEAQGASPAHSPGNTSTAAKPANWFDDAVFVGDSRTQGLENYDGLGNATYYAVKGLMVNTVYTKQALEINGKKVTVMQALQNKKFGKIYIMLGVNELGWSSMQKFVDDYRKMIDDLKKYQPQTKLYIQSILPVSAQKSASDKIYNNAKINTYNQALEKICKEKGVRYLKVNEAVSDPGGSLPQGASSDGVHLNSAYCQKWCEYLKTHTE